MQQAFVPPSNGAQQLIPSPSILQPPAPNILQQSQPSPQEAGVAAELTPPAPPAVEPNALGGAPPFTP